MTLTRKCAAFTLATSIALAALAPTSAVAGGCSWYVKISLKQQSDNSAKKCGFKGPQWSNNAKAHQAFCSSVPPTVWRKVAKLRKTKLSGC